MFFIHKQLELATDTDTPKTWTFDDLILTAPGPEY